MLRTFFLAIFDPQCSTWIFLRLWQLLTSQLFQPVDLLQCTGVACEFVALMVTLFRTNMGIADLAAPSSRDDHAITKTVAVAMIIVYHIISIVNLLSMLIAMMNLSYNTIPGNSDAEWKFARAKARNCCFAGRNHSSLQKMRIIAQKVQSLIRKILATEYIVSEEQ